MPTPKSALKKTPAHTTRKTPLRFNNSVRRRKTLARFNGNSNNGVDNEYINTMEGLRHEVETGPTGNVAVLPPKSPLRWKSIPVPPITAQSENIPPQYLTVNTAYKRADNLHRELRDIEAAAAARELAEHAAARSISQGLYTEQPLRLPRSISPRSIAHRLLPPRSLADPEVLRARPSLRLPHLSLHSGTNPWNAWEIPSVPLHLRTPSQYTPSAPKRGHLVSKNSQQHLKDLIEYLESYKIDWTNMTSEKKRLLASTFGFHLSKLHDDLITSSLYKKGGRTTRKRRTH